MRRLAARALAGGGGGLEPGELLEVTEWEEPDGLAMPEERLSDTLNAWMSMPRGASGALQTVVRCCAAINLMVGPDQPHYQLGALVEEAAKIIDGAGFAGGARIDRELLVMVLGGSLANAAGPLGRVARGRVPAVAIDAVMYPADAMRVALIALWVDEHRGWSGRTPGPEP